jgi:3-phosphoshikimate 1-carboxyvinyltransferase
MSGGGQDWIATTGEPLRGDLDIPGDKSVSHRAIMLASLADGVSRIDGFLEGEDARATEAIFRRLGVGIDTPAPGARIVHGVGMEGLKPADGPLDCGDASLSKRPMRRVTGPLARMGARIDTAEGGVPPLHIHGGSRLQGIDLALEVASAQVKSAILLAGLYADGETVVHEPHPTRDYTERMLSAFGVDIAFSPGHARLRGGQRLRATDVRVPADFSSAAFFLVAASIVPGSALRLRQVGMNPRRTGLLHVLRAMGADIREENAGEQGGEPVADLVVRHAPLHGIEVPVDQVPDMIDEFPALFVAAACAEGATVVRGAAELRVKESDRIAAMANGLRALGVQVDEARDGASIHGGPLSGGTIDSLGDHRIAMSFAVAAQRASGEVRIRDIANVATSFPGFDALARAAGFGLRAH